jgi:hypothetical protein
LESTLRKGLWRGAIYRWEKAAQLDPAHAAAYNDLAVGYEHEKDSWRDRRKKR